MKTLIIFLVVLLVGSHHIYSQSTDVEDIKTLMASQEKAWNEGDIKTFMQGYWSSDSLVFTGSNGPVYGWQNTYDRYLKTYDSPAKMGKLTFSLLQFTPLGNAHYMVLGKWHLARTIGDAGGYFTLIFRKFKVGWLIIADHTS